jgi:hypothetical protein
MSWYEHYGFSEILAANPDGSPITIYEFRAALLALGIEPTEAGQWLERSETTVRRWMAGVGCPTPSSQAIIREFVHFARITRTASYAAFIEPYMATGDHATLYRAGHLSAANGTE